MTRTPPPSEEAAEALFRFYRDARSHFGYTADWWPGSEWDIFVSAILVQQCQWASVWRAIGNLNEVGLDSPGALAGSDAAELRTLIGHVSLATTKIGRLLTISQRLRTLGAQRIADLFRSGPTEALRVDLLSLPGVGPETADAMLLYASDRHPRFIIDAYTRRVFGRWGGVPGMEADDWQRAGYAPLSHFFETTLSQSLYLYDDFEFASGLDRRVALFRDYHAQILEVGRHHCQTGRLLCDRNGAPGWKDYPACVPHCREGECIVCPLLASCATGSARS